MPKNNTSYTNKNEIFTWIFGAGGSEVDDVNIKVLKGTREQAKKYLLASVQSDIENDPDSWESGTETLDQIESRETDCYYAKGNYCSYHIDYVIRRMPDEPESLSGIDEMLECAE